MLFVVIGHIDNLSLIFVATPCCEWPRLNIGRK